MPASGFAITFPEDWTVELAEPDSDVFGMQPGTAWEALRATALDGHMACSLAVGVAAVPFFQPPDRAGSATGQGDVGSPFWDPDEPHLLWVPEPVVPDTHSSMQITWDRLQEQGGGLAGDAAYSLLCMTSDANDAEPGGTFMQLMDTFEFLPAEGDVQGETSAPLGEALAPQGEVPALPTCKQMKKAFRQDFTTGDANEDEAYLTRCVTCDELFDLVQFARVADIEMGKAILSERCDWPRSNKG